MNIKELEKRSGGKCELCSNEHNLQAYEVSPNKGDASFVHICGTCVEQIEDSEKVNANHWRCLNDSMWSEVSAIQVLAWRMLDSLRSEGWPTDLIEMLYLDEETLEWAKANGSSEEDENAVIHKDSNGVTINSGDTVVLTKDLDVKGATFTAKRGTAVRNVSLVQDNPNQIEGKVNGQQIVILTQFVKKS